MEAKQYNDNADVAYVILSAFYSNFVYFEFNVTSFVISGDTTTNKSAFLQS